MCEYKIGKCSFRTDSFELALVLRVNLKSQADTKNEATDARNKAGQKGVEGESTNETAVDKLNDTGQEHVGQVSVNYLQFDRGIARIPEI